MTTNRIVHIFTELRKQKKSALMPFITAGYPDLETTAALLLALEQAGASICEIGIPFSDPIADGPVIAASMHDALERGFDLEEMFAMIKSVRPTVSMGLVAMVSYSIVYRYGLNKFVNRCADAGFDGFIFPDLPIEESADARAAAKKAGLTCSLLIAPNTPIDRAREIAEASTGFVYLLARVGITGERSDAPEIGGLVEQLRGSSGGSGSGESCAMKTPIACGFGIGSPDSVLAVTQHAEAAIVGSAIVKRMEQMVDTEITCDVMTKRISEFVRELAGGLVSS